MEHNYVIDNDFVYESEKNFSIPINRFLEIVETDVYHRKIQNFKISEDKKDIEYSAVDDNGKVNSYKVKIKNIKSEDKEVLSQLLKYARYKDNVEKKNKEDNVANPKHIFKDYLHDLRYTVKMTKWVIRAISQIPMLGAFFAFGFFDHDWIPSYLLAIPIMEVAMDVICETACRISAWVYTKKHLEELTGEKKCWPI